MKKGRERWKTVILELHLSFWPRVSHYLERSPHCNYIMMPVDVIRQQKEIVVLTVSGGIRTPKEGRVRTPKRETAEMKD